jgi:hypothetical protein
VKIVPNVEAAYLRSSALAAVLHAVRKFQPEVAIAALKEAQAAYRTFDEIYAEEAAAKTVPVVPKARPLSDDGNFG